MQHGLLIITYQIKIILYIPKNRKENREVKKKVFVEFLSFNTYIHQKMKTCPQHPVAININDFVLPTAL